MNDILRLILPNWRFFSDIGHTYEIFISQDGGQSWDIAFPKHERKWAQIFWNPEVNLQLALYSCCEQLMLDLNNIDAEKLPNDPRLQTLEAMIFYKSPIHLKNQAWQFKIVSFQQGQSFTTGQEIFHSIEYSEDWSPL